MAKRTSRRDIEELAVVVNNQLEGCGSRTRIKVEYSYGQPRVGVLGPNGRTIGRWLSHRDRTGVIYDWLQAFSKGIDAATYPWS